MKKPVCNFLDDCLNGKAEPTPDELRKYIQYWSKCFSSTNLSKRKTILIGSICQFTGFTPEELADFIFKTSNPEEIITAAVERRREERNELSNNHVF